MSTSLLYHAFGIRGYHYTRTDFEGGGVTFRVRRDASTCRCSACGSADVVRCGVVRQVEVGFADPRRTYTRALERYILELGRRMTSRILELGRRMTSRDVAGLLGVGWDLVKDVLERDLARRFARPKLKHLTRIAVDEFAVARGHRYTTVVLDLDSGAIVFVGDGKAASALGPFWKRLRPSGAKIQAVAMDLSAAYRKAVRENLPKAVIVFDRFHVAKLFNDKLNESLAAAYYLKEELRWFWRQPGKTFATRFLDGWLRRARASGIKALQQMAKTLALHRGSLLAYYDAVITNGPLEGANNKIKTLKRTAYGFRDHEYFKLKLLALHETRYELIG